MTRIVQERAWTSFAMLPIVGLVAGIFSSIITSIGTGGAPIGSLAIGSAYSGIAIGVIALPFWALVLVRRPAAWRVAVYLAIVAIPSGLLSATGVRSSWEDAHSRYDDGVIPGPPPTVAAWIVSIAGSVVIAAVVAFCVAWPTLRAAPLGARDEVAPRGIQLLRGARHLLWTVPLTLILCAPLWVFAAISLCGISGCSGGGFGVSTIGRGTTWLLCAVIGGLLTLPIALVPWLRPWWARIGIALVVGAAAGGLIALSFYGELPVGR
jgi:hypothetical protein